MGDLDWVQRDGANRDVYNYDLADQVTTTQLNVGRPTTTAPGTPNIIYDANGNRTASTSRERTKATPAVNTLNQAAALTLHP
ncbi:MAG: hypothetical protein JO354_11480 [Verrucomicrobia bacterium]|nr:hypothetical protein [Verrucomicrobiota bacterium]